MINLNPNFCISNLIISYYGADWTDYPKIRAVIARALKETCLAFKMTYKSRAPHQGLATHSILYISPLVTTQESIKVVCLGDVYGNIDIQQQNACAIEALDDATRTLLVEGVKSQAPDEVSSSSGSGGAQKKQKAVALRGAALDNVAQSYVLKASFAATIGIYGWDLEDAEDLELLYAQQEYNKMSALFKEQSKKKKYTSEEMQKFLSKSGSALDRAQLRYDDLVKKQKELLELPNLEWKNRATEMQAERFALRSARMVQTLKSCVGGTDRVFCLAGLLHFSPYIQSHLDKKDTRFDLSSLYAYLRTIPVIVIYPTLHDEQQAEAEEAQKKLKQLANLFSNQLNPMLLLSSLVPEEYRQRLQDELALMRPH